MYTVTTVNRGENANPADFKDQDAIEPGGQVSGVIGFSVLNGATISRIVYVPTSDRLVTIVDESTSQVAPGTDVPLVGSDGGNLGSLTITNMTDPFESFDPSSPPDHGMRYVTVDASFKNAGRRTLDANPDDLFLIDSDGFVNRAVNAHRADRSDPDFKRVGDLAPDAKAEGVVAFQVPLSAAPSEIVYQPSNDQIIVVANSASSAAMGNATRAASQATATPLGTAQPSPTSVLVLPTPALTIQLPRPTEAASPSAASGGACDGVVTWWNDTLPRVTQLNQLSSTLQNLTDTSPASVAVINNVAAQLAALGKAQAAETVPPAAQAINQLLVDYFNGQSQWLTKLVTAINDDDSTGEATALSNLQQGDAVLAQGGQLTQLANALVAACPELQSVAS